MLTIVVIEQDLVVRTLFCEWFAAETHRVRGLAELGSERDPEVDLVVVDLLNLPSQGRETVRQVARHYPNAGIVGTSTQLSRTLHSGSTLARTLGVSRLIPKPCSRRDLLDAAAEAITTGALR